MPVCRSVPDSKATEPLLDENDKGEPFYADSAYAGQPREEIIAEKEMINLVCEKGYRYKLFTDEQKVSNTEKTCVPSQLHNFNSILFSN